MSLFVLYESAAGLSLFESQARDDIAVKEIQASITDLGRFSTMMTLKAFAPFPSAEVALENMNAITDGILSPFLQSFLEQNVPSVKSKSKLILGVQEARLGGAIQDELKISCECSSRIAELVRGLRLHFLHFVKGMARSDIAQAQLGLAHSYSRSKVKFNVNRVDNMVIQSIAIVDQLDKDLNTFSMRVKEWYGWHFPELVKLTNDNTVFARIALALGDRSRISSDASENAELLAELTDITQDGASAQNIIDAGRTSMGTDISAIDLDQISRFAKQVISLSAYRTQMASYLHDKMASCAPNLSALIGDAVGARLISHAGSLTNLAKYPASTVQILGAEKALFRALKTRGNTPKYGLIFNSSFIGQAAPKNKGRISRYLANKCSIASRIDSFSEVPTDVYGLTLKQQVEERLSFYSTGTTPRKNIDVMREVAESLQTSQQAMEIEDDLPKKRKADDEDESPKKKRSKADTTAEVIQEKKNKKKTEKKSKKADSEEKPEKDDEVEPEAKTKKSNKKTEKKKNSEKSKEEDAVVAETSSKKAKKVKAEKKEKKDKSVKKEKKSKSS